MNAITILLEEDRRRKSIGFFDCFRGVQLKRTLTIIGVFCFFQAHGEFSLTEHRLIIPGLGYILSYFAVLLVQLGLPNVFTILVISESESAAMMTSTNTSSLFPAVLLLPGQHVLSGCRRTKMGPHGRRCGHGSLYDGVCSDLHGIWIDELRSQQRRYSSQ